MLRVLTWLGVGRRVALALAVLTGVLSGSDGVSHWALLLALSGASALWAVARMRQWDIKLAAPPRLVGFAFTTSVLVAALVVGVTLFGDNVRRLFAMSADALAGDGTVANRSPGDLHAGKTMKQFREDDHRDYVGVGADLEIPLGTHTVTLQQDMAPAAAPSSAGVVLVSASLAHALFLLLNFAALALGVAARRQLLEGLKRRLQRVLEASATPAPPLPAAPAAV
jgi:hypothetical protein